MALSALFFPRATLEHGGRSIHISFQLRQCEALQAWLTKLVDAMHGRIHGFNVAVAHGWAEQQAMLESVGQIMPVEDGYIAATARRHGLTVITGNDKDLQRPGNKVFNPFKAMLPTE